MKFDDKEDMRFQSPGPGHFASIIDPTFAKLIQGWWFATVVVMSEGPEAGLTLIDAVLEHVKLRLLHFGSPHWTLFATFSPPQPWT